MPKMAHAADPRGKHFRDLDAIAYHGRSDAEGEQKGGTGDPVGHSQGPIDELGDASDQGGGDKNGHGRDPMAKADAAEEL
jgi:hypothetical protein